MAYTTKRFFVFYSCILLAVIGASENSFGSRSDKEKCADILVEQYPEKEAQSRFLKTLNAINRGTLRSSGRDLGVHSRALGRTSWMIPNESRSLSRPSWMPEQAATLPPLTPEQFKANLDFLESTVENPNHGLFGPDSVMWRVVGLAGEGLTFMSMNYLQLAHPVGAQGVYEHSKLLTDYMTRMQQTARHIYDVVYSDWPTVKRVGMGVYKGHGYVRGTLSESIGDYQGGKPYQALDPEALMWVYATRTMAWLESYEMLSPRPLSSTEREQYFQESKKFAMIFGIPLSTLPENFEGFYNYYHYMLQSDRLAVGSAALATQEHFEGIADEFVKRMIGLQTMTLQWWAIPGTLMSYAWNKRGAENLSAYYMPKHLVRDYNINDSSFEAATTVSLVQKMILGLRPLGLDLLPAYEIAMARIEGRRPSPGVLARHEMLVGRPPQKHEGRR